MKAMVYGLDGKAVGEVDLPAVFAEEYRPDVIRKAVNVAQANRRQPYGASPLAGRMHSTQSTRPGRGMSRIRRLRAGSKAAGVPSVAGGPKAHPPKAERSFKEKVNDKERRKAIRSALAATGRLETVRSRGHRFEDRVTFPLVVDDALDAVKETAKLSEILDKLGLGPDLERARSGRRLRAGRGKLRGRPYKIPRSVLLVTGARVPVHRAAANIVGVEAASVRELDAETLAPGGDPGRLAVFTRSAIEALGGWSA